MLPITWRALQSILILAAFTFAISVANDGSPSDTVICETTKGRLTIDVFRDWSPIGADRFLNLVKDEFFTDIAFFRSVDGFLTQFGISDKQDQLHWHESTIQDDPNIGKGIFKNYLSFAGGGENSRSTQLFIAFEDLEFLGHEPWETAFGKVVEGQNTLDMLYKDYGDIPPFGNGPDQHEIHRLGNQYIYDNFPLTDFLLHCRIKGKMMSNAGEL